MGEENKRGTVAVVLSGGGARGAFEVGVLKALQKQGIEPDIYCGTSVGSFNCAMAASGRSVAEMEQVWREITKSDVFRLRFDPMQVFTLDPRPPLRFAIESVRAFAGLLSESLAGGAHWWEALDLDEFFLDTSPLLDLIAQNVSLEGLHKSTKEIIIGLTRLKPVSQDPLHFAKGNEITHKHILASCSPPLVFPHVAIAGDIYCDGGVVMNSPLKPTIDAGAEEIFIVDLTPPPHTFRSATLPLAYQVLSTQFSLALHRDIEYAHELNQLYVHAHREGTLVEDRLLLRRLDPATGEEKEPKKYRYINLCVFQPHDDAAGIAGFLDFSPEKAALLIRQGEDVAESVLSRLEWRDLKGQGGEVLKIRMLRQ